MGSIPLDEELFAPRMSWRPDADVPVVERFGDYDVLGCVGRGGMAEILLAREAGAGSQARPVVIKRVLAEIANDPGVVHMFRDEARLVMALDHPAICRIYEVGQINGCWFIAMEWIHGASLADVIAASTRPRDTSQGRALGALPARAVAKIVADIANALDYAHRAVDEKGVPLSLIHRDVSPQNIMVGFDGRVRLLDFGLAKATTQTYKTQTGVVKGKLSYLAPEQWQGAAIDGRTDLFSLGLCLYEALTTRVLYKRERPLDAMTAVMNEPPPDVRERRPDLDPRYTMIVKTALQKKPQDRYATGALFANALGPLAEMTDPDGQLRALMRTLFPDDAVLGPSLGWLARLPQPTPPQATPSIDRVATERPSTERPSTTVSQAAKAMHGGGRSLWIGLAILGLVVAAVLYATGWRLR
jgi:serine/threonine-protein kinase